MKIGDSGIFGKTAVGAFGIAFSLVSISFLGILLVISNVSDNASAVTWDPEEEISLDYGTENQVAPSIAVEGDEVHAVWATVKSGDSDIFYRRYIDTGWEPVQEISTDVGTEVQNNPSIAVQGGEVHVVWEDSADGDIDIYYRYFDGAVWQPEQEISVDAGTEYQYLPVIDVNGSVVHVVWVDWAGGEGDIFYRYFDGVIWQPIQEISSDSGAETQIAPSIAVDSDEVHVTWAVEGPVAPIEYRHYNGTGWEPIENIGVDNTMDFDIFTSIDAEAGVAHAVWQDLEPILFNDFDILYRRTNATGWEDEQDVTILDPSPNTYPSIAVSGGLVHLTWNCLNDICYRHFNGTSWEPSQVISIDFGFPVHQTPSIAANGTRVHIAWSDFDDGDFDIFYRHFNGTDWQTIQEISVDIMEENQLHPVVAGENDKVHIVWEDDAEVSHDIFYISNNGTGWQPEKEVNSEVSPDHQWAPAMTTDGDNVHFVWMDWIGDRDVYYRGYNGMTWTVEQDISGDTASEDQDNPSIAADLARVHVVWEETDPLDGDSDIHYTYFDGIVWQSPIELSSDTGTENQFGPVIVMEGNLLHVVWQDYEDGDSDIYYRHYNGTGWEPEQEVSVDTGTEDQYDPAIAVEGGKLYLAWEDWGDGDGDIFYRHFDGLAWDTIAEISGDTANEQQKNASVAVETGNVHVTWTDLEDGDADIFYRFASGPAWQPEEEVSTDITSEEQHNSSIALDNGVLHVVWEDWGGLGDSDIHYRRGVVDTTPPSSNALPISPYWQLGPTISVDWMAIDDIGLANITLFSRYSPDNSSWLAWQEWDYNDTISGTVASGSFSFTPSFGQGFYEFYTIANDTIGSGEAPPPNNDTICGYDITPPVSSMNPIIPYWTMLSPLPINASAIDLVSKVAYVELWYRHSVDNATWTLWFLHSTNYSSPWYFDFDFPQGPGFYEFYSIGADNAGNIESKAPTTEAMVGFVDYPAPPSNVNATLTGSNLENVTVSWDLSPDDGTGNYMAIKYNIYRGTTYSPSGALYLLHDSIPAGNATYVDIQAGEGDPNDYFYLVCAVNPLDFPTCPVDQAGKFTRSLSAGRNLISIPLIQSDESIETVLQTVQFDKAWFYAANDGEWVWHMTSKPYKGYLQTINNTMGVWVDVTEDSNLTVAGVVPASTSINLRPGWNLIGYPSFNSSYTVSDLKMEANSDRVEGFDGLVPPYHLRVPGDAEVLQAGYGYWIWVDVGIVLLLNA